MGLLAIWNIKNLPAEVEDTHELMRLCRRETTHLLANPIWSGLHLGEKKVKGDLLESFA